MKTTCWSRREVKGERRAVDCLHEEEEQSDDKPELSCGLLSPFTSPLTAPPVSVDTGPQTG